MFKKISFWILIVFLIFGLFAQSGWAVGEGKIINWKYQTSYDESYFCGGSHVQYWADRVWEETNHQLKINIYYNATLGILLPQTLSSVSLGLIESCEFSTTMCAPESKQTWWQVLQDFIGIYENWEQVVMVNEVANPMVRQDILDYGGVIPLAIFPCCPRITFEGIWTNREVKNWNDFNKMKVRAAYLLSRDYILGPLGLMALHLPGSEVYEGLKTGLIDGAIQTPSAGLANHYYEVAKYLYAFEPIVPSWWGIVASQKAFDALPEDVQQGLLKASLDHEKFLIEEVWPNQCDYCPGPGGPWCEADVVEILQKEKGVIIQRVPLLQKRVQDMIKKSVPVWIADEGGPKAQKMYDVILEALEKYPYLDSPVYESLDELILEE